MTKVMDLSFLKDVKLEVVIKATPKQKISTPKLPTEADLRVFSNGKVYPSEAFAKEYDLEFKPKVTLAEVAAEGEEPTVIVGNGLDIFTSKKWGMIMGQLPTELVFVTAVPKSAAKVDLWASTKYDGDTNTPKASVFLQGVSTFSREVLVPMLADIYEIDWETAEYVDFNVSREDIVASENSIYHLPKVVSTGQHKGEDTYVRRENLTICPLIVVHTELKAVVEPVEKASMDEAMSKSSKAKDPKDHGETKAPVKDWAADLQK
jgi:hypothetical protein